MRVAIEHQGTVRDIIALMRDTGMRNERELFRTRIENLDWHSRTIFVPDSKTPEGRASIGSSSESCVRYFGPQKGEPRDGRLRPHRCWGLRSAAYGLVQRVVT